jgi:hypothetical protein
MIVADHSSSRTPHSGSPWPKRRPSSLHAVDALRDRGSLCDPMSLWVQRPPGTCHLSANSRFWATACSGHWVRCALSIGAAAAQLHSNQNTPPGAQHTRTCAAGDSAAQGASRRRGAAEATVDPIASGVVVDHRRRSRTAPGPLLPQYWGGGRLSIGGVARTPRPRAHARRTTRQDRQAETRYESTRQRQRRRE